MGSSGNAEYMGDECKVNGFPGVCDGTGHYSSAPYNYLGCASNPCKGKNCGDTCIVGGDMAGMCSWDGQCSFEYNNLGCEPESATLIVEPESATLIMEPESATLIMY